MQYFEIIISDIDGWLVVLGLTALWDSISVYIGPPPKEREKEKRNDRREKKCPNHPHPHLLQEQYALPCPTLIQIIRTPLHSKIILHYRKNRKYTSLEIIFCKTNFTNIFLKIK